MTLVTSAIFVAMFVRLAGADGGWLPEAPVLAGVGLTMLGLSRIIGQRRELGARIRSQWRGWIERHWFGLALAALTLLAFAVRLPSIASDLGHHPANIDEHRLANNVKQYLATGTVGYHTVEHYPGILFWILAGGSLVLYLHGLMDGAFATIRGMPVETFILAGRITSVVIGAATVAVVGLIGRQVSGAVAGVAAAAMVALAPLAIQTTMTNRNDPMQVLLLCAAVHAALAATRSDKRSWPLVSGTFAGLATAVKYTSLFALAPALVAALLHHSWRERLWRAGLTLGAFVAAVGVTNHFLWWDVANFVRQLSDQVGITGPGHWGAMANPAAFHAEILARFGIGWPLLLLAAAWGAYGLATGRRQAWVFWVLPILYSWFTTKRPSQFPRWVYPVLPFMAIAGTAALALVVEAARARWPHLAARRIGPRIAVIALALATMAPPLWSGVADLSRRLNPPTHVLLEQWLGERPAHEQVLLERGWLQLSGSALKTRRVADLKATLDGGLPPLAANDWVVVPEPFFRHPGLKRLALSRVFRADQHRFGGNLGYDFEIYAPPRLPPRQLPIEVRLDADDASELLGGGWGPAEPGRGRELPAGGASVFLPLASGGPVRVIVEVEGRGVSPATPMITIVDASGPMTLTATQNGASGVTLTGAASRAGRGRTTELQFLPETRRVRARVVRLVAE